MSNGAVKVFVPIKDVYPDLPMGILDTPSDEQGKSLLDQVSITDFSIRDADAQLIVRVDLEILGDAVIGIPGVTAFGLAFGDTSQPAVSFQLEIIISDQPKLRVLDLEPRLRLSADLLKPVTRASSTEPFVPDPTRKPDIPLGAYDLEIDPEASISLSPRAGASTSFQLAPVSLGDTGIVLEASGISISLDSNHPPLEKPAGWRGCILGSATIHLPSSISTSGGPAFLSLRNASIGSNGLSGDATATWNALYNPGTRTITGDLLGKLGGMTFALQSASISLLNSALTRADITGLIQIPYFDQVLLVELGLTADGDLTVGVSANQPAALATLPCSNGLLAFDVQDVVRVCVESLSFETTGSIFIAKLSGLVAPLFGAPDLKWPSFKVKELMIDSAGNVRLEGGWLDLREQYSLDFHGFQMEITKLGFGKTEDGGKWIGFSGSIKLVDGLPAGASVEGLRIIWYDDPQKETTITLDDVGVEFEVPDVLRFKGAVSWKDDHDHFDGAIKLQLISLELEVDGTLVIGVEGGNSYFAIYLNTELPAGIPLFATGLAIYGMSGLFALGMEPNKHNNEEWYENADGSPGWYKRDPIGVTQLTDPRRKWESHPDSLALGAAVTLGTASDNGYIFSGRVLLLFLLPGPIVLIQGKVNLLKERAKLDGDDPLFRALAVLDDRAGTFLIGLDARYKYDGTGKLIDIRGSAEAFFSLSDASLWHLYLGKKDPREKRIRAEILSIFEANAYLMLDAHQLATGAWVGYDKHWSFGPLGVTLQAWIDGNAVISWKPVHFHGDLWLHGKAELHVFWIDLGMTVDARFAADVFDPFHIRAGFSVCVSMPWPFDDICADITLEWGPDHKRPSLPLPLKEIAVEHLKVTASWPLPRGGSEPLLLPNYNDPNNDGFRKDPDSDPGVIANSPPPAHVPIVPLDCRPHITFGRHVNDDPMVGMNVQSDVWERIGDPAKNEGPVRVRYGLMEIVLEKRVGDTWVLVARKAAVRNPNPPPGPEWVVSPNPPGVNPLYGSWAPVPDGGGQNGGQTKLWLWSKTAFDYTRHSGRAWDDWFTDHFGDYPCVPIPPDQEICCDFTKIDPTEPLRPPWPCPDQPQFTFSWFVPDVQTVTVVDPVEGLKALCFPGTLTLPDGSERFNEITISLMEPAKRVMITLWQNKGVQATGYDAQGTPFAGAGLPNQPHLIVNGQNLVRVVVQGKFENCIVQVCAVVGLDDAEHTRREAMNQHLMDEMARWSHVDDVLEPHTTYRLTVVTTLEAIGEKELTGRSWNYSQTEYAYFRTEGPPGLTNLSVPVGYPNQNPFDSGLDDLTRYVRQTIPATVPAPGELPHTPPRPVYRAYDVGVQFNEDYVDLMYRLDRRDLGLYLYDHNNRPVCDAQGRLIVLSNRWGVIDELTVTESEKRWITVVNGSDCATLDPTVIQHDKTLTSATDGQVLDPDTIYDARLVPLLLHENFSENLTGWTIVNEGDQDGPSTWGPRGHDMLEGTHATSAGPVVALDGTPDLSKLDVDFDTITLNNDTARPSRIYRIVAVDNAARTVTVDSAPNLSGGSSPWVIPGFGAVVQTSNIWGGTNDGRDPVKPGTMLLRDDNPNLETDHPDQPGHWTDYRLSIYLRSTDDDAIGLIFRYLDSDHYYRFSMDRKRRYRRLVKATTVFHPPPEAPGTFIRQIDQVQTILAEDDFVYRQNQDYLITVEAIGSSLRMYQDGARVFDVMDTDPIPHGRIGLYCWANQGARFSDVRVDDFRREVPVIYRFNFTTSQFANFFHHLHSFQDETWGVELAADQLSDAEMARLMQAAVTPATAPSESEAHAYEDLAGRVLGPAARQNPPEVQVTKVERNGAALAFLFESPEPIDWNRTDLEVRRADRQAPPPALPGAVKLTDVTFGLMQLNQAPQPNDESVTLLLREPTDLTGHRLEYRRLPGPLAAPPGDSVLFADEFDIMGNGSNPLQHYTIVDEGTQNGPSVWRHGTGALVQTSSIDGGAEPAFPGTQAVAGDPTWTDYRLVVQLRSDADRAIGVLFRYVDHNNYYRLSLDAQRNIWQLTKKANGIVTPLRDGAGSYTVGESFTFTIDAVGSRLVGSIGGARLFEVTDATHPAGRVGLYCWANPGARFERIEVRRPPQEAYALLRDRFAASDTSGWSFMSTDGAGTSAWSIVGSELRLTSGANAPEDGTQAVAGEATWTDVVVSARLRSEGLIGVLGLLLRYAGADDYYRFSMDFQVGVRRLAKKKGGILSVLWEDVAVNIRSLTYEVTIVTIGTTLRGYFDGVPLFVVEDHDLPVPAGRIGLFAWRSSDARFSDVRVYPADQAFHQWLLDEPFDVLIPDRWTFIDEGDQAGPSSWDVTGRELQQTSGIFGGSEPEMPGTYALAGDMAWTDYHISVRLRSDVTGTLGVMFRFQDQKNYYRFSVDMRQQTGGLGRLIKKVAGAVTVLWQHPGPYIQGREYLLTLDCMGERLVGYLNGTLVFVVNDTDLAGGRIGLYAWRNPGARFAELRVAEPPWAPYYRFEREVRLPAGTRVRVYGGNRADAPPALPEDIGVVERFVASLDERGQLRLPAEGADLRLLAPGGTYDHARRFLPNGDYVPLQDMKVLRKRDGTGFFVATMPAGSTEILPLLAGQYRLDMTYRRNNQPNDFDSQVFSEAGNTLPEHVVIDVPSRAQNTLAEEHILGAQPAEAFTRGARAEEARQGDRSPWGVTQLTGERRGGPASEGLPQAQPLLQAVWRTTQGGVLMNKMNLGREKLDWQPELWNRIDQAVHDEARRTKVAMKYIPLHGPLPDARIRTVPADVIRQDSSPILTVDEGVERSLVELSVEFALTKQQYEDEERLGTASTLATRAANLLAQAEDLLIYQGDSARQNPLFQRVQLRSGSAGAGLVGAIIVGGLADQIIEVEPTEVPDPNDPTQNRYGEHTFAAVAQGYSLLQSKGHYGPYALVLHTNIYADTYAPLPTTLIMPADRIKELVTAGFYGTGTLPPFTGLLTSLGGNTMDLAVGVDSVTAFTQIDSEEQYRLRVYERFALRLKDVTALILLKFLPAQKGHPG